MIFLASLLQDNVWKNGPDSRVSQDTMTAFDMAFIIGQKSYDGYEYYDFFEQVFERLKGHPFWSNLTSEQEASGGVFQRDLDECLYQNVIRYFDLFCSVFVGS